MIRSSYHPVSDRSDRVSAARVFRAFTAVWLFSITALQAQEFRSDSCFAPSLGRFVHVSVLLPRGFDQARKYPGLLLLHGHGGKNTDWRTFAKLPESLGDIPLVIVMPDGDNSWYVNSITDPANRYEDLLLDDLVRFGAIRYRIDTLRCSIGGLSMGGFGALNAGLRHPERFRFIIALSASLDVPAGIPDLARNKREGLRPSLVTAFGADSSAFWAGHDPFLLTRTLPAHPPYLYLANGIQDEFAGRHPLYRAFADSLRARGWPYEYHETPGRHNWEFWGREIGPALLRLREILAF